MPRTPLALEPIIARTTAATTGPWTATRDGQIHAEVPSPSDWLGRGRRTVDIGGGNFGGEGGGYYMDDADAAFIAHAREDIPALLKEVDEERFTVSLLTAAIKRALAEQDPDDAGVILRAVLTTAEQRSPATPATDNSEEVSRG